MMRSLSSAVAGLRTHQTKMDVIGNNIANVNTYGFKASRTTFEDIYYQSLSSASGPVGTTQGGVNPTQIGYGSSVATIDVLNSQTGGVSTNRSMDVYITGDGYLVTNDGYGNLTYTRLGALYFDEEGNLVDGEGKFVQGFPMREGEDGLDVPDIPENGRLTDKTLLSNIKIDPELMKNLTNIQITNTGMIVATLPGESQVTIGSAAPDWMNGEAATVPEDSNLTGNIKLKVRAEFNAGQMQTAIQTVTGLTTTIDPDSITFSNDLCMNAEGLKLTAGAGGTLYLTGTCVNENGNPRSFTATGSLDETTNTLTFRTTDGKDLCSMQITGYAPSMNIDSNIYYNGRTATMATLGAGMTPTSSELTEVLSSLGFQNVSGATYTGSVGGNAVPADFTLSGATFTLNPNGNPLIPDTITTVVGGTTYTATLTQPFQFPMQLEFTGGGAGFTISVPSGNLPLNGDEGNNYYGREYDFPTLTYQYNASVMDKGENIHYFPNENGVAGPNEWGDIPEGGGFSFGDIYIPITGAPTESFNGTIGAVQMNEGENINIGCLILAKFPNNGGLEQVGTTGFAESVNSGEPEFIKPGGEGVGSLKAAQLEMSNVDISQEFTDMITTQRGFQANTRIVTVSDEMLEELVNLKR